MKGINFIEPLFYKAVSGKKTQTRRIVKSRTGFFNIESKDGYIANIWQCDANEWNGEDLIPVIPRYKPGEKLYLKEPYRIEYTTPWDYMVEYRYDPNIPVTPIIGVWENKLFMPAKYARHFIEITGVRAERLRAISGDDCFKEGIIKLSDTGVPCEENIFTNGLKTRFSASGYKEYKTPREAYAALINKISGKGTWESNPFVWVYDFKLTNK